ncbi:MAG: DUF4147 domain-containing protein [Chitinivibrionales bacterium]|nr:DUF4147 domain-containing protein [Chitinivibrionales bacterium]MBD3396689.1 DUF4147 domain-containing protein [Chitinivibrionales bacterium]
MSRLEERRQHIEEIVWHAIQAVDPYTSVKRVISRSGDNLLVQAAKGKKRYLLNAYKHIWVVGCGKAGAPMCLALEDAVGDRISGGIVVVKYGHCGSRMPQRITLVEGGHPEPDEAGMDACRDSMEVLKKATARNLVVGLISGGGSALWPQPVPPVTLDDTIALTRQLIACGADIHEINIVRKHVSLVKGGQAALHAAPADVVVLAMSDVVGDEVDTIASGPFAPDASTFADAWQVITKYGLRESVPQSIADRLQQGVQELLEETPEPGHEAFLKVTHVVCASNRVALEAAAEKAHLLGYEPVVLPAPQTGECRDAAKDFCIRLRALQQGVHGKPRCVITGGETTVTLGEAHGTGGRNQEFALASAYMLEEMEDVVVASVGTDGTDGPTDAAGALVDHSSLARARGAGLDPDEALTGHNAYPLFDALGDLIKTGPTGTNVMDIQIGIISG